MVMMEKPYNLEEAAEVAGCNPDHLRKMAKAREAPGTKVGRRWIFARSVFHEWIEARCRSIAPKAAVNGGYEFPSLAERLAARRAQMTGSRRKNSNSGNAKDSGAFTNSGTVVPFAGPKRLPGG